MGPAPAALGAFDGVLAWSDQRFNLAASGETQPVDGLVASGEFFTTLGVKAALGRTFTVADDVRGGGPDGPVVVISDGLWRRRFDGATNIIGTPLLVEGVPLTIVGVTPPGFLGLDVGRTFDVALPIATEPSIRRRAMIDQPSSFLLFVMLRLKRGQSLDAATATLRALQPQMHGSLNVPRFVAEPFTLVRAGKGTDIPGSPRQRYERPLLTVFVVAALVLLIACANVANLLLARTTARRHELSVRLAVGAPRWRLSRQLFVESLVLASAGALAGLTFALWGSRALVAQLSTAVTPVAMDLSPDWRVFGFSAAVALATAVLFGTAPAVRVAAIAPMEAIKEQGRGATSGTGRGLSGGLVVAQVALSLVLVVAAGLFIRTFARLTTMPLGFDCDCVLVVNVDASRAQIDPAERIPFYHRLVAAVAAVPGVEHAAGLDVDAGQRRASVRVHASRQLDSRIRAPRAGEFRDTGLVRDIRDRAPGWPGHRRERHRRRPARGRRQRGVRAAVPGRAAPGRRDGFVENRHRRRGRSGDAGRLQGRWRLPVAAGRGAPSDLSAAGAVSRAGPPDRRSIILSVRWGTGSPAAAVRSLTAALSAVDPNLAFTFRPLADQIDASLAQERMIAWLSGFFGVLALLLAALGLYGVTAYAVSRQRTEIGVRLALGAPAGAVVRLVLSRVTLLVGLGIAAGAGVSIWISRFVATLLYGVEPRDPVTLAAAAAILVLVGAMAGWLPAHRASRIDPLEVLRSN